MPMKYFNTLKTNVAIFLFTCILYLPFDTDVPFVTSATNQNLHYFCILYPNFTELVYHWIFPKWGRTFMLLKNQWSITVHSHCPIPIPTKSPIPIILLYIPNQPTSKSETNRNRLVSVNRP